MSPAPFTARAKVTRKARKRVARKLEKKKPKPKPEKTPEPEYPDLKWLPHHRLKQGSRMGADFLHTQARPLIEGWGKSYDPELMESVPHTREELEQHIRALEDPRSVDNRKLAAVTLDLSDGISRLYDQIISDNRAAINAFNEAMARHEHKPTTQSTQEVKRLAGAKMRISPATKSIVAELDAQMRGHKAYVSEDVRRANRRSLSQMKGNYDVGTFLDATRAKHDDELNTLENTRNGGELHTQLERLPVYKKAAERLGDNEIDGTELAHLYTDLLPVLQRERARRPIDEELQQRYVETIQARDGWFASFPAARARMKAVMPAAQKQKKNGPTTTPTTEPEKKTPPRPKLSGPHEKARRLMAQHGHKDPHIETLTSLPLTPAEARAEMEAIAKEDRTIPEMRAIPHKEGLGVIAGDYYPKVSGLYTQILLANPKLAAYTADALHPIAMPTTTQNTVAHIEVKVPKNVIEEGKALARRIRTNKDFPRTNVNSWQDVQAVC